MSFDSFMSQSLQGQVLWPAFEVEHMAYFCSMVEPHYANISYLNDLNPRAACLHLSRQSLSFSLLSWLVPGKATKCCVCLCVTLTMLDSRQIGMYYFQLPDGETRLLRLLRKDAIEEVTWETCQCFVRVRH